MNAKVGLLGHELAHIECYEEKSNFDLLVTGLKYLLSEKFKHEFEIDTDKRTIDHGLGWQLYDFELYMTKEKILNYMKIE